MARMLAIVLSGIWVVGCGDRAGAPPGAGSPPPAARQDPQSREPWFEEAAERLGVSFVHDAGTLGKFIMPEHVGSGAALVDADNDGRLDIYLLQNAGPGSKSVNRFFHQKPDGRFEDVSAGSGLDIAGYGMGVAAGDVNNDGLNDLVVTEFGGIRLFLNLGSLRFREMAKEAGLDNPRWGTSAAFLDYDRDGWLDLVVANYVDYPPTKKCYDASGALEYCGPSGFASSVTRLFRNLGKPPASAAGLVAFEDTTVKSGLARTAGPALGVICADFDGDQWPDIFLADDAKPNRLWMNRKDGTFVEEATVRGLAYNAMGQTAANMGIGLGDVNQDGAFDLFVTHLAEEYHALWIQGPRGVFMDKAASIGLTRLSWRGTAFGTVLGDFDQDGDLDLALVNGRVRRDKSAKIEEVPGLDRFLIPYAQRHQVFANDGRGGFEDISLANPAISAIPSVGRGLACGDLNGDGALDLLVTSIAGPVRICLNQARNRGHWLMVRVVDAALGGRDAIGAEVVVRAAGKTHWALTTPSYSYLCSNDPRVHFGLESASTFDEIEVLWPDGTRERFEGGPADRVIVLAKGSSK